VNNFHQSSFFSPLLIISSFYFYGCSRVEPPDTEIAHAEQIVDTALRGRAMRYAPSEFQLAQEKLNDAKVEILRHGKPNGGLR
jgi:hypothetical protein